jgi:Fe-S oxidoreductase
MMAEQTIESLKEYKIKKIITGCPHGFHALKKEYPQFGGNFEVHHLSEFVMNLIRGGKLKLGSTVGKKITLHDSCYLGRWNDIYDEPREIARAVAGSGGYVELDRSERHSFCCGAGGGYFWTEEEAPRINENRVDEILKTGADVVAVACPFCTTMITDGLKAADKDEAVQVLDISELVIQAAGIKVKEEPKEETSEAQEKEEKQE